MEKQIFTIEQWIEELHAEQKATKVSVTTFSTLQWVIPSVQECSRFSFSSCLIDPYMRWSISNSWTVFPPIAKNELQVKQQGSPLC